MSKNYKNGGKPFLTCRLGTLPFHIVIDLSLDACSQSRIDMCVQVLDTLLVLFHGQVCIDFHCDLNIRMTEQLLRGLNIHARII